MDKIGFTNFRKFQNFPTIDLGDITILVGGNNAGKSTLVKAMLLMRDFLKSRIVRTGNSKQTNQSFKPSFSFDTEHVNIGDFYRAFCRQSSRKEDTITFTMKIDKFRFIVKIRGERKPGVIPEVSTIIISDEERDITFTFDFSKNQMMAQFSYDNRYLGSNSDDEVELYLEKERLTQRLNKINKTLSDSKDFETITATKNEIERIKLELKQINVKLHKDEKNFDKDDYTIKVYGAGSIDLYFISGYYTGKMLIPELVRGFVRFAYDGTLGDKRSINYKEREGNRAFLRGKVEKIKEIANELENILNKQVIEYVYAHSVYQDSVYANCSNSIDYTKRTIHEFYTSRISQGDEEFSFIEKWLEEFKIGKSLKVNPYKGDNYSLVIYDEENPEIKSDKRKDYPGGIDLADKGMGSIQIVILLLRLSTLIRKFKGQQLTILLEEPEQNLHPALQSKLADLIYYASKIFGLHFIIETHSEYLIRKSQVIVSEKNKSQAQTGTPFKVYYLPNDGSLPYEMEYRPDGKFSNEFGTGFFDEANNLLFDIL